MLRSLQRHALLGALMVTVTLASAPDARADPLTFNGTFFLVDSSGLRQDLFSSQGAILEARVYSPSLPLGLSFGAFVDYPGGEILSDSVRFTYQEAGFAPVVGFAQAFTTRTGPERFGFGGFFEPISRTGRPVATTLKVELLHSSPDFMIPGGPNQGELVDSYTYSFFTMSPTPEPSTLLLLGTGVAFTVRRGLGKRRGLREGARAAGDEQ